MSWSGRVPVELTVTDAGGLTRPEYRGYHVPKDGSFTHEVALGTNDPTGRWTMVARDPWTQQSKGYYRSCSINKMHKEP